MCVSVSYDYLFMYLPIVMGHSYCCVVCAYYECLLSWSDSISFNVYVLLSGI
jgi:hypothetical protein